MTSATMNWLCPSTARDHAPDLTTSIGRYQGHTLERDGRYWRCPSCGSNFADETCEPAAFPLVETEDLPANPVDIAIWLLSVVASSDRAGRFGLALDLVLEDEERWPEWRGPAVDLAFAAFAKADEDHAEAEALLRERRARAADPNDPRQVFEALVGEPTPQALRPQPPPANPPRGVPVWPLVIEDLAREGVRPEVLDLMRQRDEQGRAKYGVPLCTHDGRITLIDAFQEALDLFVYLRKYAEENRPDNFWWYKPMIDLLDRIYEEMPKP